MTEQQLYWLKAYCSRPRMWELEEGRDFLMFLRGYFAGIRPPHGGYPDVLNEYICRRLEQPLAYGAPAAIEKAFANLTARECGARLETLIDDCLAEHGEAALAD